MNISLLLSFAAAAMCLCMLSVATDAFCPPVVTSRHQRQRHPLAAVTEDEVLAQVEKAEESWARALEARKEANALSDRAEEQGEAAAEIAKEAEAAIREGAISLEKIAMADQATNSNLDAGSVLSRALQAADDADRLEAIAEVALANSEEMLDQHLIDFPDSSLA
mmetsp:Transcript_939/g.2135  ORF Transcript_939/g.2135 Transcript_939/m.2135 type:complete len:165 (+) Transcript_939:44-538(+)